MIPEGVTLRSDLQIKGGVVAFGLTEEELSGSHVAHILATVDRTSTRFVVLDLRAVRHLPSVGMSQLVRLRRKLQDIPCRLVLLGDESLRQILSATTLDRLFSVAADEPELRALVEASEASARASGQGDEPGVFTKAELAELEATGVSLDDTIRIIERLRG
ncbi:MAG: STAS domain-containing protein [Gemmataceae bacterium]|nr:STAS domain-containing protein [Gemmataceae bacterium]